MTTRRNDTVTISSKYRIVIPKVARRQLLLRVGQKVRVITYGGHFSFVPVRAIRTMRGFLANLDTTLARGEDRL